MDPGVVVVAVGTLVLFVQTLMAG
jgi:hypothetical protein